MDYYRLEKVMDSIFAIKSAGGEFVYLILGDERALLIDTCVGVGNLRDFVENLTDLPITVVLSHGHVDHAMGAPEFNEVYLNPLDIPLYQKMCDCKSRLGYLQATLGRQVNQELVDSLIPAAPDYQFLSLSDGQIFDLGGIHVSAHAFPGHTAGMMAFLVEEKRILITGDACNNSTFLFDEEASDVENYRNAVNQIRTRLAGKYDRIFISHHEMEVSIEIMDNMLKVCDDILAGNADDLPYHFMGKTAYIAKTCDDHFHRLDGKDGNLIYSKTKIKAQEVSA